MSCCDANWWCPLAARWEETPAVRNEIQNSKMFFTVAAERHEHIFLVGRIWTDFSSSSFSSSVVTAAHSEFTLCFTPWKLPSQKEIQQCKRIRLRVSLTYNVLESTTPTTFALWLKRISSKSFKSTLFKRFCSTRLELPVEDGAKKCTCILVLPCDKFWWGS